METETLLLAIPDYSAKRFSIIPDIFRVAAPNLFYLWFLFCGQTLQHLVLVIAQYNLLCEIVVEAFKNKKITSVLRGA